MITGSLNTIKVPLVKFFFSSICVFFFYSVSPIFHSPLNAQEKSNKSTLLIAEVMKGEEFVGYLPENIRWHPDNQRILFSWNPEMEIIRSTYQWNIDGDQFPALLSPEERISLPTGGDYNQERTKMVYVNQGDLFVLDLEENESIRLTRTHNNKTNPRFTTDGNSITYTLNSNLYVRNLNSGLIEQLIRFERGNESSESPVSKSENWMKNDQLELFEVLRHRKAQQELQKERNEDGKEDPIYTVYTGKKSVSNQQLCPNNRFITFRLSENPDLTYTDVPNYVTESGQVENLRSRPKVGHPQAEFEFWIYDMKRDTHYRVGTEQIPDIRKKPDFMREYHSEEDGDYKEEFEEDRDVVFHGPFYSKRGTAVVVIRSLDNKDRWIMKLNMEEASLDLMNHQRDEAWIGGPGISNWNYTEGNIGWLENDTHFYFQSEETGYSHLYLIDMETMEKKALTSGSWEVIQAKLSHDGKIFYVTANKEGPHEHHFYHLSVEDGKLEKITSLKGGHQVTVSPDQNHLAIRYSFSNQPWELYYMPNKAGEEMKKVTHSTTPAFDAHEWRIPELVNIQATDGTNVPARLYRPDSERNNGAAVIFVHGAGYLQNVHHWWSSYFREYMFHHILSDNGYTLLDIDFRASSGYGRDWRTAIYRHMGGLDLSDQVDGARWLISNCDIDPERIGIYGGSYGGFISIMAMFNEPETFAAAAALRSVTDWAHYNHGYTSNILNTPLEDSTSYRRSSPIYHASGLKGPLLMLHGVIDVNVQYQDVVRLSQKLIELGKEDWELVAYPLEDHGFAESSSWSDEYRRIFYWFERYLRE
nr:S9 family peptidase [Saprospiraceae bacterium]